MVEQITVNEWGRRYRTAIGELKPRDSAILSIICAMGPIHANGVYEVVTGVTPECRPTTAIWKSLMKLRNLGLIVGTATGWQATTDP